MSALAHWSWSRDAIIEGEWWRLVTGHLVHVDLWHFLMNVVGSLAIWWLFHKDLSARQLFGAILGAVLMVNTGLWYLGSLPVYAGLSGVLHGVAAAGIWVLIRARDRWGWFLAAAGVAKLLIENTSAPVMLDASIRVATEAHLFGVIGGLLAVIVLSIFSTTASKQTRSSNS